MPLTALPTSLGRRLRTGRACLKAVPRRRLWVFVLVSYGCPSWEVFNSLPGARSRFRADADRDSSCGDSGLTRPSDHRPLYPEGPLGRRTVAASMPGLGGRTDRCYDCHLRCRRRGQKLPCLTRCRLNSPSFWARATRHGYCARSGVASPSTTYQPRQPAAGVLYQVVRDHVETLRAQAADLRDGEGFPSFVEQEFRGFLGCGALGAGFARFRECAKLS